ASSTAYLQDIERSDCSGIPDRLVCYKANLFDNGQQKIQGLQIVCGNSYSDFVEVLGLTPETLSKIKGVNILENLFKENTNEQYSEFCLIYIDPADVYKIDAYEKFKRDTGIQGVSSLEAGEIIWIKERLYDTKWQWIDGYKSNDNDEYYFNGVEKYYPNVFEMVIFSGDPGRSSLAFFKDSNLDGRWDEFALFPNQIVDNRIPEDAKAFVFDDQNTNGDIDAVSYWNCWVRGVATTVNAKNYKSTKDNPNYCYAVEPWFNGVAATTTVFAIDAIAKRIPHPATWAASTAANCLLGFAQLVSQHNWPDGGIG
ncbi:MAG: hypothetical protein QXN71_02400, partial [Candidatus Aenigmatarchaeota archaeon]